MIPGDNSFITWFFWYFECVKDGEPADPFVIQTINAMNDRLGGKYNGWGVSVYSARLILHDFKKLVELQHKKLVDSTSAMRS